MTGTPAMLQASTIGENVRFHNAHPSSGDYRAEILAGMRGEHKRIDPKWFYDSHGSELFARITALPEYYPTRTEKSLLKQHCTDIADRCGRGCVFVEPGSGNSEKARILLDELAPAAYVPIDISSDFLQAAARNLGVEYPCIPITAVCADFNNFPDISAYLPLGRRVVFYPGSTIGNLDPTAAGEFLARLRELIGVDGGVLIGVDLHKSTARLEAAYNDSAGVTAAFNLNILRNLNRLLDADFDPAAFSHRAFYNEALRRIEMHLVSERDHVVQCAGGEIAFTRGESLHTESSYKYSSDSFAALAAGAGLDVVESWYDAERLFSVHYLAAP